MRITNQIRKILALLLLGLALAFDSFAQAPIITNIEPPSGIPGVEITILGINFSATPSNNTVDFGGATATVTAASNTRLMVTVPSPNVGPVEVTISNVGGTSPIGYFTILSGPSADSFGSEQIISTAGIIPKDIIAHDLDGDGDMDVISASFFGNVIAWYQNDGAGGFTLPATSVIDDLVIDPTTIQGVDIDHDGDIDILAAHDDGVSWYENTDGLGNFVVQPSISDPILGASLSTFATDLDGDGDLDVLSIADCCGRVEWFENTDGQGSFGTQQTIVSAVPFEKIMAADIDGDGDMDPISLSQSSVEEIAYYPNNGSGSFGAKVTIASLDLSESVSSIFAADLDDDGVVDVLSTSEATNKVAWYQNNGSGSFSTQQVISTMAPGAIEVFATDMDGDGDIDVISASGNGADNRIAWYENINGSNSFGSQQIISSTFDVYVSAYAADLNGDGDMEVLAAAGVGSGDKFIWFENIAPPIFQDAGLFFDEVDQGEAAWADIDIDGDLDIILTGRDINALPLTKVYLNNNDGTFNDLGQAGLPNLYNSAIDFYDIDGDGDLDVLMNGNNGSNPVTVLMENTNGVNFSDLGLGLLGTDFGDVYFVDINNDGFRDLFVSGLASGNTITTVVYVNNGLAGDYSETTPIPITYAESDADWGDFDNDGDQDLLIAGTVSFPDQAQTDIWENDGSGNFTLVNVPISNLSPSVAWGDYDADGDLDIFVSGYFTGGGGVESVILRNDGGNLLQIPSPGTGLGQGDAQWGDFDNDGDLDVVATGTPDGGTTTVAVIFQNDGNNTFSEIDPGFVGVMNGSIAFGNYDNDGDLDVLITGLDDQGDLNTILYDGNDDEFNLPPDSPPGGLNSSVTSGEVTLSWDAGMASDDFTNSSGMTWNIYLATSSGGSDIIAPLSNISTGTRQVMANGNMDHSAGTTLSLPDGTYFWSVQAVDGAYERSAFAIEQSFTISSALPEVSISPTSMAETLAEGGSTSQTFSISNTGQGNLDWDFNSHIQDGSAVELNFPSLGSDQLQSSLNGTYNSSGLFTVEAWILPEGAIPGGRLVSTTNGSGGWYMWIEGSTLPMSWGLDLQGSDGSPSGVSEVDAVGGEWHHLAVTYDGTLIKIYRDGHLVNSGDPGIGLIPVNNLLTVGAGFQGKMDELRIWNSVRTEEQIQDDMFVALDPNTPDLVGYWPMDEGVGLTTFDYTSTNIELNFQGGAAFTTSDRPFSPSWLSASEFSGTVAPSSSHDIEVFFDATSLAIGSRRTQIQMNTNDADESQLILPVSLTVTVANVAANSADSLALVAFYNALDGDNWTDNTNWLTGSVSSWFGVTLNGSGRVTRLDLPQNQLSGTLPSGFSNLTALEGVNLTNNQLTGAIPSTIGLISGLIQLRLSTNSLTGSIPASLWTLSNLEDLRMAFNQLTGTIPADIGNLTQLTILSLGGNQFSGGFPGEITSLGNLEFVFLADNDFSSVPDFSGLSNLTTLAVENNRLTFDDLIPNQPVTGFTFSPQKEFGTVSTLNKNEGESGQINLNVDNGVSNNSYDWYRDDVFLTNSGSINNFSFSNLSVEDGGVYVAKVTNPAFQGFEITSQPQYVTVSCQSTPAGGSSATLVTINLTGTTSGATHPAHIHMNSAANGGSIVITFNPVDGTTGESVTEVTQFDSSTPVTYQELLNYNGHVIVHVAGTSVGAAVATGDIGSNAPDSMGVYQLVEVNGSGVSGTITFQSAGDEAEDSKIDRVVLGTIDNNTAGTTCETYSDFTNLSTDLSIGQTATVSVTLGTCDANYPKFGKVYVDWNLDGIFSESEVVASNTVPIDSTGTFEGTFSVPGTAITGTSAKMRVVCWESDYVSEGVTSFEITDVTGCSDALYLWGETEDYTINIVVPSLPDLVPEILSTSASSAVAGTSIDVSVRVLNESSVPAGSSTLSYVLSVDEAFDDSDVFVGETPIAAIPGFEFGQFDGSVLIPGNTPSGDYNLIFIADALKEVSESNEDNNEAFVSISVGASGDTIPPSVSYQDRPEGYIPGTGGFEIAVRATDSGSGIDTVGVFFKQITTPGTDLLEDFEFRGTQRSGDDVDVYGVTFTDTDFGTLGIEYLFFAIDSNENVGFANLISRTTTVAFESRTLSGLAAGIQVADYELISFPLVFENASNTAIFDELGTYDAENWRLFYWNNTSQSYSERPNSISAGLGYWLIFANQTTIQLDNARAVDATLTRPFTITLRNGWNQIGNPYLSTLSWSDVLDYNISEGTISSGDVGNPFIYNRAFTEVSDLEPFEGAFVEANGTIELDIPLQAAAGSRKGGKLAPPSTSPLNASDWEVRFSLSAGNYAYNLGGIGMNPRAVEGKDEFDRSTLPRLDKYLDINFPHPEHVIPFFSRDIVPTADNFTWDFTVENTLDEKKTILQWDNDFFGANNKHLVLLDQDLQKTIDMRQVNSYEFGVSAVRHFKALYGDLDYIESEIQPNRLVLGDAYPNPFNQQTTIPYSLPESDLDYRVNLSIYNSLGQRVATLVDRSQSTGFYQAIWNGKSERGNQMGPGIYIYQLRISGLADDPVLTGKLVVR